MVRFSLLSTCLVIAVLSIGCAGPMGPGCGNMSCSDCDGTAGRAIPYGPLDGLRQFKRDLVCGGGGCGETYVGEWISTPPDAQDPCCGDQWVGGATKCRPFCWQPGSLLFGGLSGLYGSRYCSGAESSAPCGCGDVCDGGCGGEIYSDEVYGGEVISGGCSSGNCGSGCSTCSSGGSSTPYMARSTFSGRTGSQSRQDARVQRIRR